MGNTILDHIDRHVKMPVQLFVEEHFRGKSAMVLTKVLPSLKLKKNDASLEVTSIFFAYVLFAITFCLCATVSSVLLSPKIFRKYWARVSD